MEICEYKGKLICAYDVTNINYALNYELKKEWKIAGKNGKLICPECGKEVILRINDPQKKVPHFSHKYSSEKCEYSNNDIKESEQHKRGKMILYNYFRELYPDEMISINYRFNNRRRTDLYCEFKDGNKLAIEYQRTALDILEWQERQSAYEDLGVNIIWLLEGNKDKLRNKEKQIEVTFFQQIMLNELEKIAIYFDVENNEFIFAKNMYYRDKYDKDNTYDELFIETYKIDKVIIKSNGKIECDFIEKYNKECSRFVKYHEKMCELKEQERLFKLEKMKQDTKLRLEKQKLALENKRTESSGNLEDNYINKSEPTIQYFKGNIKYKRKIKEAVVGNKESIDSLISFMIHYAGSQDYKVITLIFKYIYLKGSDRALNVYIDIMKKSGFGGDVFEKNMPLRDLKCPYCNGNLVERYGRYGSFVSCNNYPKCKFTFQV